MNIVQGIQDQQDHAEIQDQQDHADTQDQRGHKDQKEDADQLEQEVWYIDILLLYVNV